mmetsp:Transcript_15312/g.31557  ORF Transcript_15312/g.31557 Transcript_15312/m.31557 type:complete len:80 (+) Transcript_15312:53-292(+)
MGIAHAEVNIEIPSEMVKRSCANLKQDPAPPPTRFLRRRGKAQMIENNSKLPQHCPAQTWRANRNRVVGVELVLDQTSN